MAALVISTAAEKSRGTSREHDNAGIKHCLLLYNWTEVFRKRKTYGHLIERGLGGKNAS